MKLNKEQRAEVRNWWNLELSTAVTLTDPGGNVTLWFRCVERHGGKVASVLEAQGPDGRTLFYVDISEQDVASFAAACEGLWHAVQVLEDASSAAWQHKPHQPTEMV